MFKLTRLSFQQVVTSEEITLEEGISVVVGETSMMVATLTTLVVVEVVEIILTTKVI